MQLNKFSDYALRVLMYVSPSREQPYTIAEIATQLQVSENHLVKIVHFMAKKNWIVTTRGKGGGIRLNPKTLEYKLGFIVRSLEGDTQIVECNTPPCVLRTQCGLKGILDNAVEQFYQSLDQHTLAETLSTTKKQSSSESLHIPVIQV